MTSRISVVGAVLIAAVILVVVFVQRRPAGSIAQIGSALVADVPASMTSVVSLTRWRDRAHLWRTSLGVPAVMGAIVAGLVVRQEVTFGFGGGPMWMDPVLAGLLAAFCGGMAAELHHLKRPTPGPRVAELRPRDVAENLPAGARPRLWILAGGAVAASAIAIVIGGWHVPLPGLLALLLAGALPLAQRRIMERARPAVPADLRAADDAVRRLAVVSVDAAGAGSMLLLIGWQLMRVHPVVAGTAGEFLLSIGQLAALIVAIVWWRGSNPKRLLPDVPAALAAGRSGPHGPAVEDATP